MKQIINTGLTWTIGCLILPDDRLVFSCRGNSSVRVFKSDGSKDFEINSNASFVLDIALIPEDNTIVATSGGDGSHNISIIDIKKRKVSNNIKVNSLYYGIVHNDPELITCRRHKGIHFLKNGSCEVFDIFRIKQISSYSYIAAFANKLYYTNKNIHTVTCCDMTGRELRTFKDKSVLQSPRGITVINFGNVYVAGSTSCNGIIISPYRKRVFELLSMKDGLLNSRVLYCNRSTNHSLDGNEKQKIGNQSTNMD